MKNRFYLTDVIWWCFKKWKIGILVILIVAIILGGYKGINEYTKINTQEKKDKTIIKYEEELITYNENKSILNSKINRIEEYLERMNEDEQNCVMLMLDPYNVYKVTLTYYIDTNYEIMPSVYYQNPDYASVITNSYAAKVNAIDMDSILKENDNDMITLSNPVSGNSLKMIYTGTDAKNGVLNVFITAMTEDQASLITSVIKRTIEDSYSYIVSVMGEHVLTMVEDITILSVDLDYEDLQDTFQKNKETQYNNLVKAKDELSKITAPEKPDFSTKKLLKSSLKYAVYGIVVGIVLFIGIVFFAVLRNRLLSVNELKLRYGAAVLGTLIPEAVGKRDRFIYEKLGFINRNSNDYKRIALAIQNTERGKTAIIGGIDRAKMDELCEMLDNGGITNIVVAGNVKDDSNSLDILTDIDQIIVAEQLWNSNHSSIVYETELIKQLGKEIIGFVVYA